MTMDQETRRFDGGVALAVLGVGLLLYLPWLGSYGPLDPTDSFFIEAGREIFETNQWLLPLQNYLPWLDKPILYFWLVAGSYKLFGVSPLAGRLAAALSAVVLAPVIQLFSAPYLKKRDSILAALIFMSLPLCCAIGHESLTDMTLTMLMATAQLALYHFEKKGGKLSCLTAYIALGLAFLCKGPISVIIVSAIHGLYWLATGVTLRDIPARILKLRPFLGLAIMTAINLPWYTAATIGTDGKFFQDFFITQNFGRMTGTVNHQQPFWFYIPVFFGGVFPWSFTFFDWAPFGKNMRAGHGPINKLKQIIKARLTLGPRSDFLFFNALWACFVLVLFSAIKTKLPTYILPAMPPLAILAAARASYIIRSKRGDLLLPAALLANATMIGALIASAKVHGWVGRFLVDQRPTIAAALAATIVFALLVCTRRLRAAVYVLLAMGIAAAALLVPMGHIAFYKERQEPFEALIRRIQDAHSPVATVLVEAPSLAYYLHHHIPALTKEEECRRYMNETSRPTMILVPREMEKESRMWFDNLTLIEKTPNGKWTLYWAR